MGNLPVFFFDHLYDLEWREDASCLSLGTEMFFPPRGASTAPAKRICAYCPVREDCLDYALDAVPTFDHGIWGGSTERDRRAIRLGRSTKAAHWKRLDALYEEG